VSHSVVGGTVGFNYRLTNGVILGFEDGDSKPREEGVRVRAHAV
jgi:hypothetical protein